MKTLIRLVSIVILHICLALQALGQPNLIGFDGRPAPNNLPSVFFSVQPAAAVAGQIVQVTLYVANLGKATAGPFTVSLYLSKDANINPASDYPVYLHVPLDSIAANHYSGKIATFQLPSQDTIDSLGGAGSFFIGMVVDDQGQVSESNESDNRNQGVGKDLAQISISIPAPDLAGFDGRPTYPTAYFSVPAGLNWGDSCPYNLAVRNLTGGNAGAGNIHIFLSPDQHIGDSTDYLLYTNSFTGIPGLSYSYWSGSFHLPTVNPFGSSQTGMALKLGPYFAGFIFPISLDVRDILKLMARLV